MRLILLFFIAINTAALEVPVLTSPIEDKANLLDTCEKESLAGLLNDLYKKNGIQLQLLTIPSLEGEVIESYSIKVTDAWKLGSKKEDKGLLFLIAKNDRKMRIEVGQGLEGEITDLYSKRIIDQVGAYFKRANFHGGIRYAFNKIISLAAPNFSTTGNFTNSQACAGFKPRGIVSGGSSNLNGDDWLPLIIFFIIFLFLLIQSIRSRRHRSANLNGRRRNPWDRGHLGGGFGGFGGSRGGFGGGWSGGGGGFSGGGASGGW